MKQSLLAFFSLLLSFPIATRSQTSLIEVSGTVSGTWMADTILVTGDIEVLPGDLLTIEPGTLVLFTGHFTFLVKGAVEAAGTASDPVRFSINDTTGFQDTLTNAGGWHGFVYEHLAANADSSLFNHCIFEYGKAFSADTFGQYGGAFRVFDFNRIAFRNCTFTSNMAIRWGGAVFAKNSNILFDRCTFTGNTCGLSTLPWGYGGGFCSVHSEPVVLNCLFDGNSATGFGGGASFEYSDPELHSNTFTNNFGGLAGGFGFLRSSPARVVSDNLVHGNRARFFGGGVACIRANTVFSNITVTNNLSMYGGGFYCNDSAVPVLYNTILYGNQGFGQEAYIWDIRSAPSFIYCDVEGDTTGFEGSGAHGGYHGIYENNIDADPLFRNSSENPYALNPGSPCVDAGTPDTTGLQLLATDMEGVARIYKGRIDIGAYEWNPGQGVPFEDSGVALINAYPNPFIGNTLIRIECRKNEKGTLGIYDLNGNRIRLLKADATIDGYSGSLYDGKSDAGETIKPGIYIIRYSGSSRTGAFKLIKTDP
jgi:hypothetical protein